jgi:hypothetical protein
MLIGEFRPCFSGAPIWAEIIWAGPFGTELGLSNRSGSRSSVHLLTIRDRRPDWAVGDGETRRSGLRSRLVG